MLNVYIIVPGGVYLVREESPIRPFSRFPSLVLSSRTIPRLSGNFPADRINAYRAQLLRTTPEQTPKNLAKIFSRRSMNRYIHYSIVISNGY